MPNVSELLVAEMQSIFTQHNKVNGVQLVMVCILIKCTFTFKIKATTTAVWSSAEIFNVKTT